MSEEKTVIVEKLEPIPDFKAMPFEELMSTTSIKGNDKFNDALWTAKSERYKKLNVAQLDDFEQVDKYQDEMDARLMKLEAKFELLTKLVEKSGVVETPKQSLDKYLEDKTK